MSRGFGDGLLPFCDEPCKTCLTGSKKSKKWHITINMTDKANAGMANSSFCRSGNIDAVVTVKSQTLIKGVNRWWTSLNPPSSSATGMPTSKIDFSCTWNEKRKNASDVLIKARIRLAFEGCIKRRMFVGSEARAVEARQPMANVWTSYKSLILMATLIAHHTFATWKKWHQNL